MKFNNGPPYNINQNLNPQPSQPKYKDSQHQKGRNERLTQSELLLKNILMNRVLFQDSQIDQDIFNTDLVIKMDVPTEQYIKRSQKTELGSILRKFPKNLHTAYQSAFSNLYYDMQQQGDDALQHGNNQKQLLIRQFTSFMPTQSITKTQMPQLVSMEKQKRVVTSTGQYESIMLNCVDQYTGVLDSFIISYNSLVYSLQKLCGFAVKAFMVTDSSKSYKINTENFNILEQIKLKNKGIIRKIYILLHLPNNLLLKSANKYKIKKQINYEIIDPFLNDPMDSVNRPLRYNTILKQQVKITKTKSRAMDSDNQLIPDIPDFQQQMQFRKTIDRKIGFKLPDLDKGTAIINQVKPNLRQTNQFIKFTQQFTKQLQQLAHINHNCFNDPKDADCITPEQKQYLVRINRYKYNAGVQRRYIQLKKQRRYFQILKNLAHYHGYPTYQAPLIFAEFKLASKSKKYFNRLENMLIYKQNVVGPYGQLDLFTKMQKIKLTYSILRQNIRVQNLHMLNCTLFALNDNYQKFGQLGHKNSNQFHYHYIEPSRAPLPYIHGGLNTRNLSMDWHRIFIWRTDYNTIRSYLGQSKAFQVFIKTALIYLFVFLTPMGILFEAIKNAVVAPKASNSGYFPQFWFYLAYIFIASTVYAIFRQVFSHSEQDIIRNSIEQNPPQQFLQKYKGPYLRDTTSDNANTYNIHTFSTDTIISYLMLVVFFAIVGIQIGFYYGIRQAIVQLSYQIAQYNQHVYFIWPIHLIGYSIFFVVNAILYRWVIQPLAKYLTSHENQPTHAQFRRSEHLKLYIFAIGIEMIAPIDLVFIQYSDKSACLSSWCAEQLQAYVYCRYIVVVGFAIISGVVLACKYLWGSVDKAVEGDNGIENSYGSNYGTRLTLFLSYIYEQSMKDPSADIRLIDETVALIHFATFLTVFPLAPAISFISMLIDYNIERTEILFNQQRPIAKPEQLQAFRKIVSAIGHWMLFFNFAQMFITLEWMQYLFQSIVYGVLGVPTPEGMMTLKYIVVLVFMIVFQGYLWVVRIGIRKLGSVMDARKWSMLRKYGLRIGKVGTRVVLKEPKPLQSISRTYNIQGKSQGIGQDTKEFLRFNSRDANEVQGQAETNGQLQFQRSHSTNKKVKHSPSIK